MQCLYHDDGFFMFFYVVLLQDIDQFNIVIIFGSRFFPFFLNFVAFVFVAIRQFDFGVFFLFLPNKSVISQGCSLDLSQMCRNEHCPFVLFTAHILECNLRCLFFFHCRAVVVIS